MPQHNTNKQEEEMYVGKGMGLDSECFSTKGLNKPLPTTQLRRPPFGTERIKLRHASPRLRPIVV